MIEIRALTPDDAEQALRNQAVYFLQTFADEAKVERARSTWEFDREIGAFDDGRLVALTGGMSFETTVPGGARVPTLGLTRVGVLPTHRRRGLLTSLIREQFRLALDRGDVLSGLWASEAPIYGRFGYGLAGLSANYEIDTREAQFRQPLTDTGHIRLLDHNEIAAVIPDLYSRIGTSTVGSITRNQSLWSHYLRDFSIERVTAAHWFAIHTDVSGNTDGYVEYQKSASKPAEGHAVDLVDLISATPESYAALWRFILDLDLVRVVQAEERPIDEPLRHLLANPRAMKLQPDSWEEWTRVLDVRRALELRTYNTDESLTLHISDTFLPHNTGVYSVGAGRTEPEISLDAEALGAVYLGGTSFGELATAGRLTELVPGAVTRADRLFATRPRPWNGSHY
jgi:predicted acetyltransferase